MEKFLKYHSRIKMKGHEKAKPLTHNELAMVAMLERQMK